MAGSSEKCCFVDNDGVVVVCPKHHSLQINCRYGVMPHSVSDGLGSSAPRVRSSSSAISSGEHWVEAAEFKSLNAAVKARKTSSAIPNNDWERIWKGSVTLKDMKFNVTMEVFDVNNPSNFMKSGMPLSLEVVGNIDKPEIVWTYLKKVKETIDAEVIFLQCTPTSYADWKLYSAFCKACQDMGIAVLGGVSSPIKNLYLFPVLKGRPIPKQLVSLSSGMHLLENRASNLLLGILVMCKGQQRKPKVNALPAEQFAKTEIKGSPDSSKEQATPSKVANTNSESTTRRLSRFSLKEAIWGGCQRTKDHVADEATAKQIATEIEESLYSFLNKDVGPEYKRKYRSLIYWISDRNNPELLRNVITKKISPDQLVRMSTEELTCRSFAEWREKRAKHQLDLVERNELVERKSTSSCLPLSSTTLSLRTTKSKAESSLTTPKLKSESLNSTQLSDSYSSRSKLPRQRSDLSKQQATPSTVAKTRSESTTRTLARFSLKEAMWGCCQRTKDLVADETTVKKIATEIEESLYSFLNKDVGGKYKNKYRSLIYSITYKYNPELFRDVVTKKISPDQLVRLSHEELTCSGFAEWREKRSIHQLE